MNEDLLMGGLLTAVGLFSLGGAVFNWSFFMNSRKARSITKIMGVLGARIFYGILGVLICVLGVLMATGILAQIE